jgi:hypothetical protein
MTHNRVPEERLKVVQNCVLCLFSAVPAGLGRLFKSNPGLASWAKFSRPSGTHFAIGWFSRSLFGPSRFSASLNVQPASYRQGGLSRESVTFPKLSAPLSNIVPLPPGVTIDLRRITQEL